jgi:hypothetical protein
MPDEDVVPSGEGILERKTKEIEEGLDQDVEEERDPLKPKGRTDEQVIQEALAQVEEFAGAQNIDAKLVLTLDFLKGYELIVDMGVEEKRAFVFVFHNIDMNVLKFMVETAKADNINNIIGFTPNAVVAKDYKTIKSF